MKESRPDYSDEKAYRIAYLIAGYIRKTLTEEEHDELDAWVVKSDENMKLFEDLTDEDHLEANLAWMDSVQTEEALAKTAAKLTVAPGTERKSGFRWKPYAVAASVLLVIAAALYLRTGRVAPRQPVATTTATDSSQKGTTVQLTLGDGTIVNPDAVGTIPMQGGTTIKKTAEGTIMYTKTTGAGPPTFNTLATPTGSEYSLTLADGTRVWLNAQSSLTYPVQFGDSSRQVELTGEAYFEVAKDRTKPFVVQLPGGEEIRVLGTAFNVLAYRNEDTKKVTLVEGRVQVTAGKEAVQLRPNEQALLSSGALTLNRTADVEAATAWKRDEFVFRDATVYELMRQVERWYDVHVIFRTPSSEQFNLTISRKEPLTKLLRLIELTGKIHFKLDNKTIYVLR